MLDGVAQKYKAVQAARAHAQKGGTVEADQERVEAELIFEKYVYELYNAALGQNIHAEVEAHGHTEAGVESAGGHEHVFVDE